MTETLKWRQACYVAHGGNIAILASLGDSVAVSFLKGVLLDDPDGRLEAPGPNSRSARYMRFGGLERISADERELRVFVRQAIENERTGRKVEFAKDDLERPGELIEAFGEDPELARAFEGLTPGRQRGWILHFGGARKPETRKARIGKARPKILQGKGMHDN